MSILTRPNRKINPRTKKPPIAPAPGPIKEGEAPDRGIASSEREAPESGDPRFAEAPDAGDGRVGVLEHEFTHGRSQS